MECAIKHETSEGKQHLQHVRACGSGGVEVRMIISICTVCIAEQVSLVLLYWHTDLCVCTRICAQTFTIMSAFFIE